MNRRGIFFADLANVIGDSLMMRILVTIVLYCEYRTRYQQQKNRIDQHPSHLLLAIPAN